MPKNSTESCASERTPWTTSIVMTSTDTSVTKSVCVRVFVCRARWVYTEYLEEFMAVYDSQPRGAVAEIFSHPHEVVRLKCAGVVRIGGAHSIYIYMYGFSVPVRSK